MSQSKETKQTNSACKREKITSQCIKGIKEHAIIRKLLKDHCSQSFCSCHGTTFPRVSENISSKLVQFCADHHLAIFATEKSIIYQLISGRVDAIFKCQDQDDTYVIVDWKFPQNHQVSMSFDTILQLNLYRYILRNGNIEGFTPETKIFMYVVYNATIDTKIKIYQCNVLQESFIQSIIINAIQN